MENGDLAKRIEDLQRKLEASENLNKVVPIGKCKLSSRKIGTVSPRTPSFGDFNWEYFWK